MKAIETHYKGYRFRSRLEARWAVFFDHLDIRYEYEPEGFELSQGKRYLPDFRVTLDEGPPFWFEVKGKDPTRDEFRTCHDFADQANAWVYIASGTMDSPANTIEGFKGAKIHGFSPLSSWDRVPEDKTELIALRVNWALYFNAFYEHPLGGIYLDHLYAEDIPFAREIGDEPRIAMKLSAIGIHPTAYFGQGRLYRSPRLTAAYDAARSARFEFGENGAG